VGWIAPPDDVESIRAALLDIHGRWKKRKLPVTVLSPEWRERLSRAKRVEELADVLRSVA
jgi:hypothetical protein